jgi:Cu(I)/Ag(I) efflux system periplasmic protein CusF
MKTALTTAALAVALALAAGVPAVAQQDHGSHGMAAAAKPGADVVNTGEVKRINKDTKKITIAHGPLKAFDMPAMTMAFPVKDPAMLARVKQGDKVNFVLEKAGEDMVITRIEPAKSPAR